MYLLVMTTTPLMKKLAVETFPETINAVNNLEGSFPGMEPTSMATQRKR